MTKAGSGQCHDHVGGSGATGTVTLTLRIVPLVLAMADHAHVLLLRAWSNARGECKELFRKSGRQRKQKPREVNKSLGLLETGIGHFAIQECYSFAGGAPKRELLSTPQRNSA